MHAGLYSYHVNQINIELESFKIIGILNNVLGGNDAGAEKGYKYAYSITPKSFKKTVFGNHPALTIEIEGKKEKAVPSANGEFLDVTPTTKTEKHFTLIYLFDGSHFSPTKETVQTLTEITHFLD